MATGCDFVRSKNLDTVARFSNHSFIMQQNRFRATMVASGCDLLHVQKILMLLPETCSGYHDKTSL